MRNKNLYNYILIAGCGYVVYSNIRTLLETPYAEWDWAHWLMIPLSIIIAVLGGFQIRTVIQKERQARKDKEEGKTEEEEKPAPKPAETGDEVVTVTLADLERIDEVELDGGNEEEE